MIPVAMMAAAGGSGATRAVGGAALRALPSLAVAGVGGYVAHRVTDGLAVAAIDPQSPGREHAQAIIGVYAPAPALGVAALAMGGAFRRAHQTTTQVEILRNLDTGDIVRLGRDAPRGWTLGPRTMRAGSIGAVIGAGIAAGLAVPVVATATELLGKGSEASVRAAMPDWLEGPATFAPRMQAKAVEAVVDVGTRIIAGGPPQEHRFRSEFDVDPATGFDPLRDLGLQTPDDLVTSDGGDNQRFVEDRLLDQIEQETGARPEPSGP